jgi:hypothetical protein
MSAAPESHESDAAPSKAKTIVVDSSFLQWDLVEKMLGCVDFQLGDMPEDLRKLTPPLKSFRAVLIPLQRNSDDVKRAYEAHGVTLQFTDSFLERRNAAAATAKSLGLDDRPYILEYGFQNEWTGQFGETPVCGRCQQVPSMAQLSRIHDIERMVASTAMKLPPNHAQLIDELLLCLPWHGSDFEEFVNSLAQYAWNVSVEFGSIELQLDPTFSIEDARTALLTEVGYLVTAGDALKLTLDEHPSERAMELLQEVPTFNELTWKKFSQKGKPSEHRTIEESLAHAYVLFAKNELPSQNFPVLCNYMQELFNERISAQQVAQNRRFYKENVSKVYSKTQEAGAKTAKQKMGSREDEATLDELYAILALRAGGRVDRLAQLDSLYGEQHVSKSAIKRADRRLKLVSRYLVKHGGKPMHTSAPRLLTNSTG